MVDTNFIKSFQDDLVKKNQPFEYTVIQILKQITNFEIKQSSFNQNIYDHSDVLINGFHFDIKQPKLIDRYNPAIGNCFWVEMQNVWGNKGWCAHEGGICSISSDYSQILLTWRKKIWNFCEQKCPQWKTEFLNYNPHRLYTCYNRKNSEDRIIMISEDDVAALSKYRFKLSDDQIFTLKSSLKKWS